MTAGIPLLDGEILLTDVDEVLFRQATTPLWDAINRQPSSTAFGPASIDAQKPSFSRSSLVTAQASRDWHQKNAKSPSHGVWGCTVGEVIAAASRAIDDSATPGPKAPGHAYVDYRGYNKSQERLLRSRLLIQALARGEFSTTDCLTS